VLLAQFTVPTDWWGDWCGMVWAMLAVGTPINTVAHSLSNRRVFSRFNAFAFMA
jgi:hypothetical protein